MWELQLLITRKHFSVAGPELALRRAHASSLSLTHRASIKPRPRPGTTLSQAGSIQKKPLMNDQLRP
jgi:hypothetical protein